METVDGLRINSHTHTLVKERINLKLTHTLVEGRINLKLGLVEGREDEGKRDSTFENPWSRPPPHQQPRVTGFSGNPTTHSRCRLNGVETVD